MKRTQADQLISALRQANRWMTWGDIEALRISTCPWKRLAETGARYLKPGERLDRKEGKDGLLRLKVVKV